MQAALFLLSAKLFFKSTLAPFAVSLKVAPSISAAPRHISIRCRKISKYSYMLQISVSICRFSEMTFFSVLIFSVWSVTA